MGYISSSVMVTMMMMMMMIMVIMMVVVVVGGGGGDDDDDDVQKVNGALVSDITAGYHLLYSQEDCILKGTSIINC